jgi:CheY-like chemotaxis protein
VLSDVMMPGMDGFELAGAIAASAELAGATVLMLSSAGPGANVERCRELGVRAYLHKPLKASELLDTIMSTLPGTEVAAPRTSARPGVVAVAQRQLRILLAEDNMINQEIAVAVLEGWGHHVVVVDDGRQAVDTFVRERFDLVFMDVQMPEMGGFEATACIRAHELDVGIHVPIVAMTARAMAGDQAECLAAGMDGYVAKPIELTALASVIETMVRAWPTAVRATPEASDAA